MAISSNKVRIAVTLTKEQVEEFDKVAKELGVSKSALMSLATVQFVRSWKMEKGGATAFPLDYNEEKK